MRELLTLTEERIQDPGLALWATEQLRGVLDASSELTSAADRLEPRAKLQDDALSLAREELSQLKGAERAGPLGRIAAILRGRPNAADAYLETLLELIEIAPDDRNHAQAAERVLARLGRHAELEGLLEGFLARASSAVERGRHRLALATLKRRRGDTDGALEELMPLLVEPGAHGAAWNLALLLAAQREKLAPHAQALLRIAGQLSPSLRAVLTAVAAEELLEAGDIDAARAAAEQACHADPSLARPAAARARVGVVLGGRLGAESIERAMSIVVPRASLCSALARFYDDLGESPLAAAWAQRQSALRPGDLAAAEWRLSRATAGDDGARLADTLAWVLSQPQALGPAASTIAKGLARLSVLSPGRAAALSRRALDVLGPRDAELRGAALGVADTVGEGGLGIAVIERWLGSGSLGAERGAVLLDLARRRKYAGDADGAARALYRALGEGASAREVMEELDAALPTRGSDGEIALLRARAEALSALPEADQQGTARAWRELGAALFDLASDPAGAQRAWERAMALDAEHGVENFASDLIACAGEAVALERLIEHGKRRGETSEAARFFAIAAGIAFGAGRSREAFECAKLTLEADPTRGDAIAIAERAASESDLDALDALYDRMAGAALGRFGERAVRYRAARQLERRGALARALHQATLAFESVPSEGVVFVTLARLADRAERRDEMVRAIGRVAERSNAAERSAWLRRAALLAGDSEEGERQRIDVLLRALSVRAEADLIASLGTAIGNLVRVAPDERDAAEVRFRRAVLSALSRGDGPEGARIAIEAARTALKTFGAAGLAAQAIERASLCDGDLDEFGALLPDAGTLAAAPESEALVAALVERSSEKFAGAGAVLLELGAAIATARGDAARAAVLLVAAAERDPERLELVRRAEHAAKKTGDRALVERVLDAMPDRGRFALLMDLAAMAEKSGDDGRALDAIERARVLVDVLPEQRAALFDRSVQLLSKLGRRDELEALLANEIERPDSDARPRAARGARARVAHRSAGTAARGARGARGRAREAPRPSRDVERHRDAGEPGGRARAASLGARASRRSGRRARRTRLAAPRARSLARLAVGRRGGPLALVRALRPRTERPGSARCARARRRAAR